MDSHVHSKFSKRAKERAKEEFGKKPEGSYFLNVDLIRKYHTSIAIPTASEEATFDIDDNGNLRLR